MIDITSTRDGFAGNPAQAPSTSGTGGCCGNQLQATLTLPAAADPCCGTTAEATQAGSCCGTAAKAEAVAAKQGCCG